MGNDHSQMSGMQVEEKAVEVTDFWSHHSATISSGNNTTVSVFIGEPLVGGSLWVSQTPLEKASKNLMLHRHPCILKYISSWNKSSKYYLAVEDVKPLAHILSTQITLQVCVGLHSILKALVFLHENASASHNNLCTASIYVTKDGNWKLGGMEYLCKFKDMNAEYMGRSRSHRYNKAVDPNEDKNMRNCADRLDSVDVYAFGTLVIEVFKKKSDETVPSLLDFLEICKNSLQNVNVSERPKLRSLLEHPFFNHEFISIHSYLTELPLKCDTDKNEFFSSILNKLKAFDEKIIAKQLGGLLLSRMVLLNKTAQSDLIPYILKPKQDAGESDSIFTVDTFKKYMIPKLLEIFCVRDAQIRLLLLEYFSHFMNCFSKQELQSHILPELLVGIKDTNDHLVAVTLRALADLIPILGSATVIGGKRAKLFNDGRPILHTNKPRSRRNSRRVPEVSNLVSSIPLNIESDVLSNSSGTEINLELPERPSPDGEEGETSTDEVEPNHGEEEEEENWDDWEINEEEISRDPDVVHEENNYVNEEEQTIQVEEEPLENIVISVSTMNGAAHKKSMPDIFELDIKNQKNSIGDKDDFDFFQDMEPVIETSSKFVIKERDNITSKLDLSVNSMEHHEEGWGDDLIWDE